MLHINRKIFEKRFRNCLDIENRMLRSSEILKIPLKIRQKNFGMFLIAEYFKKLLSIF